MPEPCKIRLHRRGEDRIDIWLLRSELDELLFDGAVEIDAGNWTLRIPCLEGTIASKFAGLSNPERDWASRYQDAGDFSHMIEANSKINITKLREFGAGIRRAGGNQILSHVEDARAGRCLKF